ncbi:MAG: ClpXP protease specificity-enhancing factor SspB [Rhodospirillaceae bacterium]
MAKDFLRYDKMVEAALRGVVRSALKQAAEFGLPDNHHFYVTFRTGGRGVKMPGNLRAQYPGEMTIVLQHQFYGLEVAEEHFAVTLSFNNVHAQLVIPFAAINAFADPSVSFELRFQPAPIERLHGVDAVESFPPLAPGAVRPGVAGGGGEEKRGEVVAFDTFRKK